MKPISVRPILTLPANRATLASEVSAPPAREWRRTGRSKPVRATFDVATGASPSFVSEWTDGVNSEWR